MTALACVACGPAGSYAQEALPALAAEVRTQLAEQAVQRAAAQAGCQVLAGRVSLSRIPLPPVEPGLHAAQREHWSFELCGRKHTFEARWWNSAGQLQTELSPAGPPSRKVRPETNASDRARQDEARQAIMERIGLDQMQRNGCRLVHMPARALRAAAAQQEAALDQLWEVQACGSTQRYQVSLDHQGRLLSVEPLALSRR